MLLSQLGHGSELGMKPLLLDLHEESVAKLADCELERWERIALLAGHLPQSTAPFADLAFACGSTSETLNEGIRCLHLSW